MRLEPRCSNLMRCAAVELEHRYESDLVLTVDIVVGLTPFSGLVERIWRFQDSFAKDKRNVIF